ncbi:HigA family addiction module antitoxin [uncultured Pelagibacterium sp.]|uniref:HigA family addiction module antitoxin n=1 Tax=uncultured Pelagibacterium sp. TaxID=1159875 RepID=UPI0030D9546E
MSMTENPVHPGEVLNALFLAPPEMSAGALAGRLDVPRTRIERLAKGETALSADTAPRPSAFLATPLSSG